MENIYEMINPAFLNILNEIKEKEYSFRDIIKKKDSNNSMLTHLSGPDICKEHLFGPVIGLLIYLKYKNIIPIEKIKNKIDLSHALSLSQHKNAKEILAIWNEIEDNYPYLDKLLHLLSQYDFSEYQHLQRCTRSCDHGTLQFTYRRRCKDRPFDPEPAAGIQRSSYLCRRLSRGLWPDA
jgi:hypothetical protein